LNKATAYQDAYSAIAVIWKDEGGETLDDIALMATINSVLAQQFHHFYWTGFYRVCGTRLIVSDASVETDDVLLKRLGELGIERVRLLTRATEVLRTGCLAQGVEIDVEPVSESGRRELRRWMREQAISRTAHRHGRVAS